MNKTALLLGATGLVGSQCLKYLLADVSYASVKIITRRSLNNPDKKLIEYISRFEQIEKLRDAFICDDVFCCLGTTIKKAGSKENFKRIDFWYPYNAAQLALKNGAKQFLLVSSIGADKSSKNFYLRVKGEVEESISSLEFYSVVVFRPSLLIGKREEFRVGEKVGEVLSKIFSPVWVGRLKKYKPVEADKVAKIMVLSAAENYVGKKIIESDEIIKKAGA